MLGFHVSILVGYAAYVIVRVVEFLKFASYQPQFSWLHFLDDASLVLSLGPLWTAGSTRPRNQLGQCQYQELFSSGSESCRPSKLPSRQTFISFWRVGFALLIQGDTPSNIGVSTNYSFTSVS
jgi:hypothetical protein